MFKITKERILNGLLFGGIMVGLMAGIVLVVGAMLWWISPLSMGARGTEILVKVGITFSAMGFVVGFVLAAIKEPSKEKRRSK